MGFPSDSTSRTSPLFPVGARRLSRPAAVRRAAASMVETLENRRLLAVVSGGETAFYYNGSDSFKIEVIGEGSFTFTAAVRPPTTAGGGVRLDEVPMSVSGPNGFRTYAGGYRTQAATGAPLANFDIYSIHSANTTAETSLSITQYTVNTNGPSFSAPFGNGAAFNTFMGDPGQNLPVAITTDNGGVFIGGRIALQTGFALQLSLTKNSSIATSEGVSLPSRKSYNPGIYINGLNNTPASMDNLYVAGTITGRVDISGSVDTFYAGNVITGDPVSGAGAGTIGSDNFRIGGDLRNLLVAGGIGFIDGAPDAFLPDTDLSIGGRVQQIKATDFRASIDVSGTDGRYTDGSDLDELESRGATNANAAAIGFAFDDFQLLNQGFSNNDSFDTPQILGSFKSDTRKTGGQAVINGSINNFARVNDLADYYGVPMLAGTSVNIQVTPVANEFGLVLPSYIQVYDPDGRLVATDRSNQNDADFINKSIRVSATSPGLWRVAVVPVGQPQITQPRAYQLTVDRLGDMGVGGLQVSNDAFFGNTTAGLRVRSKDLGAVLVGGSLLGGDAATLVSTSDVTLSNPIEARGGSIRSVEANEIGGIFQNFRYFPNIVASDNIGLIRANGGDAYFNNVLNFTTQTPSATLNIGGDYQVVEAAGDLAANLSANGSIGVIRAGSIAAEIVGFPGYFLANADNSGSDSIGLISATGNFGNFASGGTPISCAGGNVRYFDVGGTVYRDEFFGAGQTEVQQTTDQSVTLSDDSGATVTLTPIRGIDNTPVVDPNTPTPPAVPNPGTGSGTGTSPIGSIPNGPIGSNPDQPNPINQPDPNEIDDEDENVVLTANGRTVGGTLSISTYPIRSGGQIIYRVVSTDGLEVSVTGTGPAAAGDLTTVRTGSGSQLVVSDDDGLTVNPTQQSPFELGTGQALEVLFTGTRVNVFDLAGSAANANFSSILNYTDGEIIGIDAGDVGTVEAHYLGVGRTVASARLEGLGSVGGLTVNYPFNDQRTIISLANAVNLYSRGPMGNITLTGSVQNVVANSDNKNTKKLFEGIIAPVLASGTIRRVEVGEGLATSGSGRVSMGGIYSETAIGLISNDNGFGDIRGDVIADYIEGIRLRGAGSIIDADILQRGDELTDINGETLTPFSIGFETITYLVDATAAPQTTGIGDIRVLGTGGIINSQFVAQNIGTATVASSGFGILTSKFFSSGASTMKGINAGGLGIRSTSYTGGAFIGDVVATGGGELLDLNRMPASVRLSNSSYYDEATGIAPNAANDVYLFFATSSRDSTIEGVTNSGIIADTRIAASRTIESVRAFDFRAFDASGLRARDESFPDAINFGDRIGGVYAKRNIDGLRIVGATLGTISAGGSVSNFQLQTSGNVDEVIVKKNVLGTSNFNLTNEGTLGSFRVGGNMNGTISAAQGIGSIIIDGDVRSARDQGGIYSAQSIGSVKIGGDVRSGAYIRARKAMGTVTLNSDFEAGAVIRAIKFSRITVRGANEGDFVIS